jgi:Flp pilus assembly protein TadD
MAMTEERTRAYKASFVPVQRLLDAGRFPDAVAELERLTAANTECAEAHNDLAVLYHAAGRLVDADRESRRALELDPFHADIRDNRNAITTALGNVPPAAAPAPAAPISFAPPAPVPAPAAPLSFVPPAPSPAPLSFAPPAPLSFAPPAPSPAPLSFAPPAPVPVSASPSAPRTVIAPPTTSALAGAPLYSEVLRTAETLLASGQLDAAVAEIERFVDKQPATAEAWNDLGVLHRDAGRFAAAKAALVVALTIEPENRQAGHNLTRVLLEMGQHTEALRTLEPFLTRAPRDPEALTLAGDISFALHQSDDASAFYRAALAVEPANVEVAVKLANAAAMSAPIAAAPAPSVYLPPPSPPAPPAAPSALPDTLRALEYDPRVRLVTPDETYDTVTCKTPLDRLPNPIAALAEMARLLKPGGKLWIDLGGPLEVIKHSTPKAPVTGAVIDLLPAFRAR